MVVLLGIAIAVGLLLAFLPVTIHGHEIHGLLHAVFGTLSGVIAIIIFHYLAILTAPLIGCLGMIMISVLMFVGFILIGIVLPLLLPALVLSLIVWAYHLGVRKDGRTDTEKPFDGQTEANC